MVNCIFTLKHVRLNRYNLAHTINKYMNWILHKALNDIRRRKIRSVLTVLGIFIGVAGIVAIVASAQNMTEAQRYNYANSSQDDMSWWVWDMPVNAQYAVEQLPNVAAVMRRAEYNTQFRLGYHWNDIIIFGLDDYNNIPIDKMNFVEGRPPHSGEIAFEQSVLQLEPNLHVGDTIIYRAGSTKAESTLVVSGFAKSPAYPSAAILDTTTAYAVGTDVRKMLGTTGDNQLLVRLHDLAQRESTKRDIENIFHKRNLQFGGYYGRDPANYLGKRELDTLILLLLIFSGVGLVISGFLVANTLSAIVTEQIGEIGTMKALGAGRKQVLQVYLVTASLYGVVGSILGILGGFGLGKLILTFLGSALNFDVSSFFFQPAALFLGLVVGMGVTLLAALIPAWRGTAISVRQAMDNYGISSSYGQGWFDRLLTKLRGLPPLVALALRNLARRKTRNLVTYGVIALSCAAFLGAQITSSSVDTTINRLYSVYGADAWLQFAQATNEDLANYVKLIPGVVQVEPWASTSATIGTTTTRLWGVPADTTIYQKPVVEGRWFASNENYVALVTTNLAKLNNIKVGATVEVDVGKQREDFQVIGLLDDNSTYLGSTATGKIFTSLDEVDRLLQRAGTATFFCVTMSQHSPAFVDQTLEQISRRFVEQRPQVLPAYSDRQSALQITAILQLLLYAMVVIIAIIGAIGVVNTLTLNVLERRREVGVLRSIGGSNERLVQIFVTEGLFLGIAGFLTGLLLGLPLAQLLIGFISQNAFAVDFNFQPQFVLFTLGFALILTVGASLGPALGAARIKISNILRYS
jgi:putative ABC transport system permease protein